MPKLRLFWAINLPPALKAKLAGVQEKLKTTSTGVKWIKKENLHLTLQFLGNAEEPEVARLVNNMQRELAGCSSFRLTMNGLGFFPDKRRPRVLWAGVSGNLPLLQQLHKRVQKANLLSGFPAERRAFSPHLTLARLRSGTEPGLFLSAVNKLNSSIAQLGEFDVDSVDLMKSILSREGPSYTLLTGIKFS